MRYSDSSAFSFALSGRFSLSKLFAKMASYRIHYQVCGFGDVIPGMNEEPDNALPDLLIREPFWKKAQCDKKYGIAVPVHQVKADLPPFFRNLFFDDPSATAFAILS